MWLLLDRWRRARAGKVFPDYNMAAYITRHVAPAFGSAVQAAASDEGKLREAVAAGTKEVEIWERQAAIYGLYQRPIAPVVVRSRPQARC